MRGRGFGCGCAALLLALGLTIFAVILHTAMKPSDTMVLTEAVISDMERTQRRNSDGDLETNTTYYVDYTFNGKKYERVRLNYSTPSMKVGNEIQIYVEPSNPSKIKADVRVMRKWMTIGAAACWIVGIGISVINFVIWRRLMRGSA